MLRASIETTGGEVDLRGLADPSKAEASGIPGAALLLGWVDATVAEDSSADSIAECRGRVREALGAAAMIDAAGIMGNFERMVRIADATGIPLDTPVRVATETIRADLGIDEFASAAHSAPVKGWQRFLGRALLPLLKFQLSRMGRRRSSGAENVRV